MGPELLILAAGIGSRYGGLKQIEPVGSHGEAIIDYSVFDAMRSGFKKLVFVIRKEIEKDFRDAIGKRFEKKIDMDYVFQRLDDIPSGYRVPGGRTKPWGTGQAILTARDAVKSPFAVINGDDFYGHDSFRKLSSYLGQLKAGDSSYAMVSYTLRNTLSEHGHVSRGLCSLDSRGNLKSIVEHTKITKDNGKIFSTGESPDKKELTGDEIVSMNMFGFTPGIFQFLERDFRVFLEKNSGDIKAEFYIPSVVGGLINSGEATVTVINSSSDWFGITYKEDKTYVTESIGSLVNTGAYPDRLWEDA